MGSPIKVGPGPRKIPFSLTFVQHEEGDTVGKIAALLSLAPIFIVVAYCALLVGRRELHIVYMLFGQLANGALNASLKQTFGQPRPSGSDRTDPGMPSDHAQFMGFWAAYIILFARTRVQFNRSGWHFILCAAVALLAELVADSRVYLGYHTRAQVRVGLVVGALAATGWYAGYEHFLRPNAARVLEATRPVSEYLYLKDCSHIKDIVSWEFESVAAERARVHSNRRRQ